MTASTLNQSQSDSSAGITSRDRDQTSAIVVHALHKSASMFLFSFFQELSAQAGIQYYSANLPEGERVPETGALPAGFCVCPVRSFVTEQRWSESARIQRIFHVRDPRDILVSEYFSIAYIHPVERESLKQRRIEARKMTVDEYAREQSEFSEYPLEEKFAPLLNRMQNPGAGESADIIVRYETMVTRFHNWVRAVLPPFGFSFPAYTAAKLAWRYRKEFTPPPATGDEQMTHKRRITPGDFRNKLSPETIEILNDRFAPVLDAFGYER